MATLADLTPVQPPTTTPGGQRILEAASELFYLHGITTTGLDLVVDRAGVTKRTLYQRFGSKDGLIRAYLAARAHKWQSLVLERVQIAFTRQENPVTAVFDLTYEWVADNPRGCGFVNAWAELGDSASSETKAAIQREKLWMRKLFEALTGSSASGELIHELYEGVLVCATILGDAEAIPRAKSAIRPLAQPAA